MNWKAVVHTGVVTLLSILAGAVDQYFNNGGVIPQTTLQWHSFFMFVGSTALIGVVALLKQSPLAGSLLDPAQGGIQAPGTVSTHLPN
jgi:hypothetical protein